MSNKYYEILGINKDATEDEIKDGYKKMARKWHPDKNPQNKDEATEKFKMISEAYNILSDPSKKEIYDKYGEDGLKQHDNGMDRNGQSPEDIFNMFFGGGNPFGNHFNRENINQQQKTQPKIVEIPLNLKEIYFGTKKKITIKLDKCCHKCDGFGGTNKKICIECNGNGVKIINKMIGPNMIQRFTENCKQCNGSKYTCDTQCDICKGKKIKQIEEQFIITVDCGVKNDDSIVYENKGNHLPNEIAGDIIFIIKEANNSVFTRMGNDLIYNHNLTIGDSLVGCNIRIDHINGEKIIITEDNFIKDNSYSVVNNKGMPYSNGTKYGVLYIVYSIDYPTKKLTNEEKDIIKDILPLSNISIKESDIICDSTLKHNFSFFEKQNQQQNKEQHHIPRGMPHGMPHGMPRGIPPHMGHLFSQFF